MYRNRDVMLQRYSDDQKLSDGSLSEPTASDEHVDGWYWFVVWRSGSIVRHMNEVTLPLVQLVHLQMGIQPQHVTKPTMSCIPPGSLNRVPALIG